MKRQNASAGMTMVEVIISMAIVCIAALMMLSAVSVSQSLMRRGMDNQRGENTVYQRLEDASEQAVRGHMTYKVNGKGETVEGDYYIGTVDGVELAAFVPED